MVGYIACDELGLGQVIACAGVDGAVYGSFMGPAAYRFVSYSLLRGAGCYAIMALLRSGHTAAPPGPVGIAWLRGAGIYSTV